MSTLCHDCIYNILDFNESYHSCNNMINKKYNALFNKNKYYNAVNKINSWYKKNTYPFNISGTEENNKNWYTKKNVIQYYRKYYPLQFLISYPEYIVSKLNRNDLQEYINNNMNSLENRKKSEVISFLNLPTISKSDIEWAGW